MRRWNGITLGLTGMLLLSAFSIPVSGEVIRSQYHSELIGEIMDYVVWLPPGYEESTARYPVLYLLHGAWMNAAEWFEFVELESAMSSLVESGEVSPMVIAAPSSGKRGRGFYTNFLDGSYPWEDYFFEEFIPHIEDRFRVWKERQYRGITGSSMGGYGAMRFAILHSDLFGSASSLAGMLNLKRLVLNQKELTVLKDVDIPASIVPEGTVLWTVIVEILGGDLERVDLYNPYDLAKTGRYHFQDTKFFISAGRLDQLLAANQALDFVEALEAAGAEYILDLSPLDIHSRKYFIERLPLAIKFHDDCFSKGREDINRITEWPHHAH